MTTRQYDHVVKKGVSESLKSGFQLTQEMEIEHQTKLGFFVTFLKHQKHVVPIVDQNDLNGSKGLRRSQWDGQYGCMFATRRGKRQ